MSEAVHWGLLDENQLEATQDLWQDDPKLCIQATMKLFTSNLIGNF